MQARIHGSDCGQDYPAALYQRRKPKVGGNDGCPCGGSKKLKKHYGAGR